MSASLPRRAIEKLLAEAAERGDAAQAPAGRLERYRLVREVGRGGMGVVHEAFDVELGRRVALKVLAAPVADAALRERFVREARAAARLDHPGIAAVHDAGEGWIAMRFVDGVPLARYPRGDVRRLTAFVRDAALAVHRAHEQGVIHRDLKPANLLVEGERVIVTDFGLAKDAAVPGDLSVSGHLLGTPAYMSPEQAEGRVRDVDPRTDVWGLGATLYDLLAGRAPFARADVPASLRAVVEDEPAPIRALRPDVPRDLETIVQRCLAKERERRYASARELADDLTRWLAGEPVLARPPSIGYRLAKFARRRRALLVLGGASAAALAVVLAIAASERVQRQASGRALGLSQEVASVVADAEMHARLGEIELAAARLEAGIAACRAFLASHDVAEAHALCGRLLRVHGRVEEARVELDRALELDPELVEARFERGMLAAGGLAAELSRLDPPASPDEAARLTPEQATRRADALADLAAAVERPEKLRAVDALLARAEAARLAGDRGAARAAFEEVLRLETLSYDARVALSQLDLVEGDATSALKIAMSLVDLRRGFGPAYVARRGAEPAAAEIAAGAERVLVRVPVDGVEGALADVGAALQRAPSDAAAHANRGVVLARRAAQLWQAGWPAQAVEVWGSAVEACRTARLLDAGLAEARNNLAVAGAERARVLEALGRSGEAADERAQALVELDGLVAEEPRCALGWLNRGIVRRRMAEAAEHDAAGAPAGTAHDDLARALELATDERLRRFIEGEIRRP